MQADPYTRAILTFIALCLLVLVARDLGVGAPEAAQDPAVERGPWTLQMVRTGLGGPPTLLRMNSVTGEVWQVRFGPNQKWALLGDEAEAADAPAPAPPPAPPAPAEPPAAPEP